MNPKDTTVQAVTYNRSGREARQNRDGTVSFFLNPTGPRPPFGAAKERAKKAAEEAERLGAASA